MTLSRLPFNLAICVNKAKMTCSPIAVQKGIKIKIEIAEITPNCVVGDPIRIEQVLINLFGNAIKFSPENTTITLRLNLLESETQKKDEILLLFAVEDHGRGIPKDKQKIIFEKFNQLDNAKSSKELVAGTGIGLSICKHVVELMGGNIWVESEVKKGSIFYFTVRTMRASEEAVSRTEKESETPKLEFPVEDCNYPLSILVAEDNLLNQLVVKKLLEKCGGYKADVVNDGEEAISALRKKDYDLIIMDVQMPNLDGLVFSVIKLFGY